MIDKCAAIVLAAGKGTRLAGGSPSLKPKVLFKLAGRPMISYTLDNLKPLGLKKIIIVIGYKGRQVREIVGDNFKFATQTKQLGTGHAVKLGLAGVSLSITSILVLNGDDSAFYTPCTIKQVLDKHLGKGNTITFVSLEVDNPAGLGRVIRSGNKVMSIVEEKDASNKQKKIKEVNDGLYVFRRDWLEKNISKIKKSNAGEYYLVDLIKLATGQKEKVEAFKLYDVGEWYGVNTPSELKAADKLMRERISKC